MFKVDNSTAATTQPALGPVGPNPNAYFREANAGLGQVATKVPADWLNTIQNELANVITGAGLTLVKATQNQLYTAIQTLITAAIPDVPDTVIKTVTQNGHGFTKGKILYNASGTWALAQADNLAKSFSVGMVYEVLSTNTFKIIMLGYISGLPSGMNLTANTVYYLSATVAGGLQTTRPNVDGLYIKAVLTTDSTTSGYFSNPQPMPVSSGGGGGGDLLAENNLSDLDDVATARDNLELGTAAVKDVEFFIAATDYDDFMQASVLTTLLTKAGNLSGIASASQARVNLGLGNIATMSASDFASTSALAGVQTQIDDIVTDLDDYALITYVDSAISGVNSSISTLSTTVSGHTSALSGLSDDISDINGDISTINTALGNKQPLDATLTSFAALSIAANKLPYGNGSDTFALADYTSYGRTLTALADAAAGRTALALVIGTDVQAFDATLAALAGVTTATDKLIYATDVDTFATTTFTSFARSLVDDTDASTMRTTLGLVIGTNVQAYNAALASIAGLTTAADLMIYATAANTYATTSLTSFARTILDDADASTVRTTLGLVIGTNVQAFNAALASIAGLTTAADKMVYTTASNVYATTDLSSFARTLLDDTDATAARATLGAVIGTNVQAYNAALASIAGLATGADKMIYTSASNVYDVADLTSFARTLLDDADATTMRATLGAVIGTNVQAYDATLAALAGLTIAADKLIYGTGADAFATTDFTSFARTLVDDSSASAARTTLGLGTRALLNDVSITANTTMVSNTSYLLTSGGTLDLTLPATSSVGDIIEIAGYGATGWNIVQGSGQSIMFGNTPTITGATGFVRSTHAQDTIILKCVATNTTWKTINYQGFPEANV